MKPYFILIFESIHKVMKAEQSLLSEDINCDIIPTPKEYSSDCGMSIRLLKDVCDLDKIKEILTTQNIKFKIHEK